MSACRTLSGPHRVESTAAFREMVAIRYGVGDELPASAAGPAEEPLPQWIALPIASQPAPDGFGLASPTVTHHSACFPVITSVAATHRAPSSPSMEFPKATIEVARSYRGAASVPHANSSAARAQSSQA
jgi:hypothetical protein